MPSIFSDGRAHWSRDAACLRIGAADSFAARILPELLASLAARHPALQVDVTVETSMELEQLLLDRRIDIAFLGHPRAHEKITIVPLWPIDLVWVIGHDMHVEKAMATPESVWRSSGVHDATAWKLVHRH